MSLIFPCSAPVISLLLPPLENRKSPWAQILGWKTARKPAGTGSVQAHGSKSPAKSRASGVHRLSRPQPLNVAVADRGDAVCRKPFADRAAGEQRVFPDAPAGMLRRDRLDLARHRRMQRE